MSKRRIIVLATVASVGLATASMVAAQRMAPPARLGLALVNPMALAEQSPRMKQALETLKQQYETEAAQFKAQSEEGNQLVQQFQTMKPGSPEYAQMEARITKMKADFELKGKRVAEDFKEREARLFHSFSRELQSELSRFAEATGTMLILRHAPSAENLTDPRAALQEIHKLVVYERDLEATPAVQRAMSRDTSAGPQATRPAPASQQQSPYAR